MADHVTRSRDWQLVLNCGAASLLKVINDAVPGRLPRVRCFLMILILLKCSDCTLNDRLSTRPRIVRSLMETCNGMKAIVATPAAQG